MILGVVQARMGSSRLPGKVMADLGGRPVIDRVVSRLRASALVDEVVRLHLGTGADFSANRLPPPARRTTPVGLDVEVARREALETAWRAAREPADREHVMPFLYREPGRFRVSVSDMEEDLSGYRWTVDTPEDLEAVRAIWAHLDGPLAGWAEVLAVVREHPEISELNAQVAQKHVDVVDERWRGGVG